MRGARAAWLVARREVRERVRARVFRIWTAVIALAAAALVVAASIVPGLIEKGPAQLGVVAGTSAGMVAALQASSDQLGIPVDVVTVASRADGEAAVRAGDLDALFVDAQTVVFDHEVSAALAAVVNRAVQAESLPGRLQALGLTVEQARPLLAPTPVGVALLQPPKAADTDAGAREGELAGPLSVILLYVSLAVYGGLVLNGVVEEKTNRVIEVLLGTLRASDLLAGKVFGIMAIAVLQVSVALVAAGIALVATGAAEIPRIALGVAAVSIAWFALGLTFYCFGYAAMGATVSRASDAQSAAMPMTMLLLIPYLAGLVLVPGDPNGTLVTLLSIFPVSSPMVMPARVALGDPAWWEVGVALTLMIPAIVGMIWLAGRIYRGAILQGGGRVRLLQAIRSAPEV